MKRQARSRLLLASCLATMLVLVAGCGTKGGTAASDTIGGQTTTSTQPSSTTEATTSTTTTTTTTEPSTTTTSSGGDLPDVSEWTSVTDTPSGVSFKLPKKPAVQTPAVTAPDGSPVKVRAYQALINFSFLLQVSVFDLSGRSFDSDKAIDGVATSTQGTVTSRVHTTVGGLDVTDVRINIPSKRAVGYNRVFKVGDHAVQLQTLGLATNEDQIRSAQNSLVATFSAN